MAWNGLALRVISEVVLALLVATNVRALTRLRHVSGG